MIEKESYRALLLTERGGPARRIRLQPIRMGDIFDKNGEYFLFCRNFWNELWSLTPSFDLSFLSVYGNL